MSYAIKQNGEFLTYVDTAGEVYLFDTRQDALDYLEELDEQGEVVDYDA